MKIRFYTTEFCYECEGTSKAVTDYFEVTKEEYETIKNKLRQSRLDWKIEVLMDVAEALDHIDTSYDKYQEMLRKHKEAEEKRKAASEKNALERKRKQLAKLQKELGEG